MNTSSACYTVICKHHAAIDACDPWSEFVVVVSGVDDPSRAAVAACGRLVKDNGGKAEASMVIAGVPSLHIPANSFMDSEDEQPDFSGSESVVFYRELN